MVWEWALISFLGGLSAILGVFVYVLLARVPGPEDLYKVGTAIVDAKIKEFGFTSSGPGGRPAEGLWGFVEKFLSTEAGQNLVKGFTGGQQGWIGP